MATVETTNQVITDRLSKPASVLSVKNVLFATDCSTTSEAALPYATSICRRFGSTLHIVHVLSDAGLLMMSGGVDYVSMGTILEDSQDEAKERLQQIASLVETIPHRIHIGHGQVWKNLELILEANEIDLIVVGTHGRTGLGKMLLGSVAEDILRHAPCPVLTVGPKVSGHAKLPAFRNHGADLAPVELDLRQIVFATNFAICAPRLAQEAITLAGTFHARLTVMHVVEDYAHLGSKPEPIEEGCRRLKEMIPADTELQYIPETLLDFGHAPERILKAAEEREADMILLGACASREVGSTHLPWSVAPRVIAQAHCPVLTIRE